MLADVINNMYNKVSVIYTNIIGFRFELRNCIVFLSRRITCFLAEIWLRSNIRYLFWVFSVIVMLSAKESKKGPIFAGCIANANLVPGA